MAKRAFQCIVTNDAFKSNCKYKLEQFPVTFYFPLIGLNHWTCVAVLIFFIMLSCTEVYVIWAYPCEKHYSKQRWDFIIFIFYHITYPPTPSLYLQSYHSLHSYHVVHDKYITYTINLYCDYSVAVLALMPAAHVPILANRLVIFSSTRYIQAHCYGTTPVCKQNSSHIHNYSLLS